MEEPSNHDIGGGGGGGSGSGSSSGSSSRSSCSQINKQCAILLENIEVSFLN